MNEDVFEIDAGSNYVINENEKFVQGSQLKELFDFIKEGDLVRFKEKMSSQPDLINIYDKNDNNVFMYAIMKNEYDMAEYLVDEFNVEKMKSERYNFSALHFAVSKNVPEVILNKLLSKGADVHAKTIKGLSVLSGALANNNLSAAKKLKECGADVSSDGGDFLPLMSAARFDGEESIRWVLDSGGRIDGQGVGGKTALMIAAIHNNEDGVKALLACGASLDIQSDSGLTALDYAKQEKCKDAIKALGGVVKKVSKKKKID